MTEPTPPDEHPVVPPPAPAPDAVLARARAAALDAFDEVRGDTSTDAGGGSVPNLTDARRRRWTRLPLGAAAAALAVVALVGVFASLDSEPEENFTATGAAIGDADASSGGSGEAAEAPTEDDALYDSGSASGGGADGALLVPQESAERESYPDLDTLVDELAVSYAAARTTAGGSTSASESALTESDDLPASPSWCDPVVEAGIAVDRALVVVRAQVDGRTVLAVVYDSDAGRRVALVDATSCSVEDDRPL